MSNDSIYFDPNGMRNIASQMTTNANNALTDHDIAWQRMRWHIQEYPANLQNLLFAIVGDHEKRLRATYHWQLAFADTLSKSADDVDQAELDIKQLF